MTLLFILEELCGITIKSLIFIYQCMGKFIFVIIKCMTDVLCLKLETKV